MAQHGAAALVPAGHPEEQAKLAANSGLANVLKNNPKWLTSLNCKTNLPHASNPLAPTNPSDSYNWSGWQDYWPGSTTSEFNSTYMTYKQPPVPTAATTNPEWVSIWAGLGTGDTQTDQLVQTGTQNFAGHDSSGAYYGAEPWFELYPMQLEQVITNFPQILTGDTITTQVLWSGPKSGGTASFILCDARANTCAYPQETPTAPASFSGQTNEWIVERPSVNGVHEELYPFGTLNISGAKGTTLTSGGSQASFTLDSNQIAESINMENCASTQTLASTSGLTSPGAFSVTWKATGVLESC